MTAKPLSKTELRQSVVAREPEDHKGVFGHVVVVAGSRMMPGAAILATRAALRSGAGLVTAAVPFGVANAVAAAAPAAMVLPLPDNPVGTVRPEAVDRLKQYALDRRATTLAIGPGLTTHPDAARFVLHALSGVSAPAVVDADALNVLAQQEPEGVAQMLKTRKHSCVFTPHPAEAARILRLDKAAALSERAKCAERLARDWGGTALLKGHKTVIASGVRTVVNATGGPALAKGGSGDVLTGLIAGLWAQMLASGRATGDIPFKAAALGAWLHGAAGDLLEEELTPWGATAEDLVEALPRAFKALCG
jgi:ADP-dependent NAD(P)H-hydrate dehydratase / NAD(P)H-hydrate epimerase